MLGCSWLSTILAVSDRPRGARSGLRPSRVIVRSNRAPVNSKPWLLEQSSAKARPFARLRGLVAMPGQKVHDVFIHQVEPFGEGAEHGQRERFGRPRIRRAQCLVGGMIKRKEPHVRSCADRDARRLRPEERGRSKDRRRLQQGNDLAAVARQNSLDRSRPVDQKRKMIVGLILRQQNRIRMVPSLRQGPSRSPAWFRGQPHQATVRP